MSPTQLATSFIMGTPIDLFTPGSRAPLTIRLTELVVESGNKNSDGYFINYCFSGAVVGRPESLNGFLSLKTQSGVVVFHERSLQFTLSR